MIYFDTNCNLHDAQISFAIWSDTFFNLDKYIGNLDKYIFQFGQIHLAIWTNTFFNLDKYIWQFGQIHLEIWTNTFFQFGKIHFSIWTNTFGNLTNTFFQFGKIHFSIWTNTFGNLDKYIKQEEMEVEFKKVTDEKRMRDEEKQVKQRQKGVETVMKFSLQITSFERRFDIFCCKWFCKTYWLQGLVEPAWM